MENPHQRGISYIYKCITVPAVESKTSAMLHWESLIKRNYTPQQWRQALQKPLKVSKCILHWDTVHEILNNWFLTRTKLARIYPSTLPTCWRECGHRGTPPPHTYLVDFPPIKALLVYPNWIYLLYPFNFYLRKMVLLGLDLDHWPPQAHTILSHIFIATRLAIARHWKSLKPPSITKVILSLNNHCLMEYIYAMAHLQIPAFLKKWNSWLAHPKCSPLP